MWEKTSLQNSTFFRKVPFQNRIFKEKVYFEIMPFKKSTKSEKLVVVRGANRVKTLFLRRDVFKEIWFLNINWTRNLFFRKKICLHKMIFRKVFYRNPPGQETLDSKTDQFVGNNFTSRFDFFFQKNPFQNVIFNGKVYFKTMPFKTSTKSENYVVFLGANWVRTFFFRCEFLIEIWFLNKNWTQKLSFWKIFFLQNMIIRKVFFYKICRNEKFSIHNLKFWKKVFSKSHFVRKSLLQNMIPFSRKNHLKLWFLMKKFASKSCLLKKARKMKNLFFLLSKLSQNVFFRCEIWFLNKRWTQKLNFWQINFP